MTRERGGEAGEDPEVVPDAELKAELAVPIPLAPGNAAAVGPASDRYSVAQTLHIRRVCHPCKNITAPLAAFCALLAIAAPR